MTARKYSFDDHPEHKAQRGAWAQKWIADAISATYAAAIAALLMTSCGLLQDGDPCSPVVTGECEVGLACCENPPGGPGRKGYPEPYACMPDPCSGRLKK